ncbi:MAG: hypothetical protein J2P44_00375 [Candidatus Dormibacteraeota bacterium]|nr:hypothetical protein [Candidatus Dormibacteraeota bacterium]
MGRFLILDETTVRVHLSFNVEQALDHLDVEESAHDVTITAWIGWKQDAHHVQNPRVAAAGRAITWRDVRLQKGLGQRRLIDGARPDQVVDPRASEPNRRPALVDLRPVALMRLEALGERTLRVNLKLSVHQLIDHLDVDEDRPDRVTVTAWVGSRREVASDLPAAEARPTIVHGAHVTLARPLGARLLVDGAADQAR